MKTRNLILSTSLFMIPIGYLNAQERPNIVFIFMDDMGYADLSCYGQTKWSTPNIDFLAENGIKFTDAYSASSISSASRAGLMTGRYPNRMGIQGVFFPESYTGIPQEELLLPEILKTVGYTNGIVGKWHLGSRERFLPLQNGFDEYFGIPYSNDMSASVYLRGNEVEEFHIDQSVMTKKYTAEAIDFIVRHKDKPFFLYLAHNMTHVPIFCSDEFKGKSGVSIYGDAVLEVDWSVGEVIKELKKHNILENTIIIFSSDNGPWLQEGPLGGEAVPLREGKTTSYEGGVRIPAIAYWKGKISPRVNSEIFSTLDWLPTLTNLCGAKLPQNLYLDGYNQADLLLKNKKSNRNIFAYFNHNRFVTGLRVGDWKISLPQGEIKGNFWRKTTAAHDTLLFNLKEDPSERNNLYNVNVSKSKKMITAVDEYKANYGDIPPALVMVGNNQFNYLRNQRKEVIEKAIEAGVQSRENIIDGF